MYALPSSNLLSQMFQYLEVGVLEHLAAAVLVLVTEHGLRLCLLNPEVVVVAHCRMHPGSGVSQGYTVHKLAEYHACQLRLSVAAL